MIDWPTVRGLSVRQPWCEAIVDGHKPIENRRRGFPSNYRGTVLIHAALQWSDRGATDPRVRDAYPPRGDGTRGYALRHAVAYRGRPPHPFLAGYVLGHADLVDVHPDGGCCRPWGESDYTEPDGTVRTDLCHLVFDDPVRYASPIAATGRLGLWRPSPELIRAAAS